MTLSDPPYKTDLLSADFDGGTAVVFNAYGLPDRNGSAVLRAGGELRTVAVDPSGRVTVTTP